jgi:uncharacterized membrane protein
MTAASSSSADPPYPRLGLPKAWTRVALVGCLLGASPLAVTAARADLRLCNMTTSRVGIAVGYRDPQGWVTEGWWNLNPRGCETLLKGQLAARYFYIYAVDYDRGGEWSGRSFMCTRDREFTIRGVEDCFARGFDRSGFFEVDTGEQKSWTIQLMDPNRAGASIQ